MLEGLKDYGFEELLDDFVPPEEPAIPVSEEVVPPVDEGTPVVEPVAEVPTVENPPATSPVEKSELDLLKEENEKLRLQVVESATRVPEVPATTQVPETPEEEALHDFFGEKDPQDLLYDKDAFNKFLNDIYRKARNDGKEQAILSVQPIIRAEAATLITLKEKTDKFYSENSDLATPEYRKFCGAVATEISTKNPEWDLDKVFQETAAQARARLNLGPAPATAAENTPPPKPAFARGTGGGSATPSTTPGLSRKEKDIADLLEGVI